MGKWKARCRGGVDVGFVLWFSKYGLGFDSNITGLRVAHGYYICV